MRTRNQRSRAARYPRHWPLAIFWAIGFGLSVWLLLALTYVIGRKQPKDPTAVPAAVLAAAARPGTALAATCVLLLLGAWCLRHLTLNWHAWRPGRIEVAEFVSGSKLTDADLKQHTLTFRGVLAKLQLQAPSTVPGAAPEGDFLDVLGRGKPDVRNVLGTLISLLRAASPTHTYELHGVLRERAESPRYGVTVQVLRLPAEGSLPIEVWGETWELALRRAADEATAAILPQTRRCRAPWAAWRRRHMPEGLVHAYEEATRLEQERRYDEALGQYYAAAELDPMNMVLRLRIGQLQERLGQYLDALAMYCGMLEAARPAGRRLPWWLYRGAGRHERRRALLAAATAATSCSAGVRSPTTGPRSPAERVRRAATTSASASARACGAISARCSWPRVSARTRSRRRWRSRASVRRRPARAVCSSGTSCRATPAPTAPACGAASASGCGIARR